MPEKHNPHKPTTPPTTAQEAAKPEASGFKLPNPDAVPAQPATPPSANTVPPPVQPATPPGGTTGQPATAPLSELPLDGKADTSARDLAIGGGVLLVLVIVFFFLKNAHANRLVGNRVSPRSANASGWWLFVLLTSLATAGLLGIVNHEQFLTPVYLGIFGVVALIALIGTLSTGRR